MLTFSLQFVNITNITRNVIFSFIFPLYYPSYPTCHSTHRAFMGNTKGMHTPICLCTGQSQGFQKEYKGNHREYMGNTCLYLPFMENTRATTGQHKEHIPSTKPPRKPTYPIYIMKEFSSINPIPPIVYFHHNHEPLF